ncbi:MAG: MATE family efflux transporter [Lachnospiraceae bacterium]|nr:MATE family efflux transporter [Lachnospiraceae bacterium]
MEIIMNYLFSNKDLRKLIVPLIFEQALAITVGMADTMMISSVGEAAVSGVSLVDMVNMLIFSVLAALATGGAVVTSQFIGAKKPEKARLSAKQLLYTVIIASLLLSVLAILARGPLLRLFFGSIETDVMENALIYLTISAISFPFLAVYNACAALFRSMGNSQITLKVSILMNAINICGNALCIFVLHMGVAGVAVPSLVSRAVAGILLYIFLRNPRYLVHFDRQPFSLDWSMIKNILYIGIPSGIENGIFQLGRVLVVSIISGFGTVQIAANGVANNLDAMGCIIGQAMNLAMITVIGRCVGANDENQIRYYTKKLLLITYISTIALNSWILLSLNPILNLYGLSQETTRLAWLLVMIHDGSAMILWPVAFVLPNMLRACNDVRFTMVVSIFSMFAFRIGFSYLIGVRMGTGAVGVWIAMIIDWLFRLTLFIIRYLSGRWKKLCLSPR